MPVVRCTAAFLQFLLDMIVMCSITEQARFLCKVVPPHVYSFLLYFQTSSRSSMPMFLSATVVILSGKLYKLKSGHRYVAIITLLWHHEVCMVA